MNQKKIIDYCDILLNIHQFQDYCPNGLQVEGDQREVRKIALGVSISLELIEKAIQQKADLIITHHGLLWNKDDRRIQGPFREKIKTLLDNGIGAAAYHLPLDFHPEIGNNVQLAKKLGLTDLEEFSQTGNYAEAIMGKTDKTTIDDFSKTVENVLQREPTVFPFGNDRINKIAIITGAAQDFFIKAVDNGADCFLTGEVSEKNYSMSKEYHVHFISAGHYATEKFGIQVLGEKLENEFDISCEFIDIPNPV